MIGALLVGGYSKRMGQDKALLQRSGQALLPMLVAQLRHVCDGCILVGREQQRAALEAHTPLAPLVSDLIPDSGPLGGLYTALKHSGDDVLLLACDLPFMQGDLLLRLRTTFEGATPPPMALIPRHKSGECEPACAVWGQACLPLITRALVEKRLALHKLTQACQAAFLDLQADEQAWLRNLNTPQELEATRGEVHFRA